MDSRSLHTASSYINNLLLSRGLLRNGKPIDFAEPAKTDGGVDATMARVMNLVHDLILRRDVRLMFKAQSVRTMADKELDDSVRPIHCPYCHTIYKQCGYRPPSRPRRLRASKVATQTSIGNLRSQALRRRQCALHFDRRRQGRERSEKK